jgi:hypothetical protein
MAVMLFDKEYLARMPNPEILKRIIAVLKGKNSAVD